jgi:methyl-accepting chemotaxis protein
MLNALNLKLKLTLLSGIAALALIANIITGSIGINGGINGVAEIGRHSLPSILALQKLQGYQTALRSSTYEVALWENDPEAQDMFKTIAEDKQRIWGQVDLVWKEYEAQPKSAVEETRWKAFSQEWEKWKKFDQDTINLIVTLSKNTDFAQQKALYQNYFMLGGQQRPAYQAAEKMLAEILQMNAANVQSVTQEAETTTGFARQAMTVVGASALLITVLLAFFISKSILCQIGGEPSAVTAVTNRIAEGDLSQPINIPEGDQGSLMASIANMQTHLRALIGQIQSSAGELSRRSNALTREVDQVASNGIEESSAAQNTAHDVAHILGRINHIGDAADQAKALSDLAGNLSQAGQSAMGGVVREMEDVSSAVNQSSGLVQQLGRHSKQISSIVSVIKEIADQTNLLALNAAIEAARAGEQGRGFAVVADEVRKLAERTGKSTDEISSVVSTIQNGVNGAVEGMHDVSARVENGVGLVRNASDSMERIHTGAVDASQAVTGIHAALNESMTSLGQIEGSMNNIVHLVERNGHSVGTMTVSSKRVEELAQDLHLAIERFHL